MIGFLGSQREVKPPQRSDCRETRSVPELSPVLWVSSLAATVSSILQWTVLGAEGLLHIILHMEGAPGFSVVVPEDLKTHTPPLASSYISRSGCCTVEQVCKEMQATGWYHGTIAVKQKAPALMEFHSGHKTGHTEQSSTPPLLPCGTMTFAVNVEIKLL